MSFIKINSNRNIMAQTGAPVVKGISDCNIINTSTLKYYDLEKYILTDVRNNFNCNGHLNAFDFFCIIIWKANRAKTKIAQRLIKRNPDLEQSVLELTSKIFKASNEKSKFEVLYTDYGFRLPMASAILSILYPDSFTVYDVRVCETLTKFQGLDNTGNFDKLWLGYEEFIKSVRAYGPTDLSLREKDRLLWSKSFSEKLTSDIKSNFSKAENENA